VDGDAGEVLTVQRAAFVAEARRYGDPDMPPLREDLDGVRAAIAEQIVLVAVRGTRLVGSIRLRVEGSVGHVGRLAVAPDQERRGIGTALLRAAEAAVPVGVRSLSLFTGGDSAPTIARYERAGYGRVGESTDDHGTTLVHLTKPL
jgi:ribosomal protein S18 acetylase RimI-like enzyme